MLTNPRKLVLYNVQRETYLGRIKELDGCHEWQAGRYVPHPYLHCCWEHHSCLLSRCVASAGLPGNVLKDSYFGKPIRCPCPPEVALSLDVAVPWHERDPERH